MKEKEVIFITGSTGLLGVYLIRSLLKEKSRVERIIALSRGKTQKEAKGRVLKLLAQIQRPQEKQENISLLEVICGDITQENLGLSNMAYNRLTREITSIYHSAAICEFKIPLSVIRRTNVKGTENVLKLALACQREGRFRHFHHISTIAVAGKMSGIFYEKDLDLGQRFNNTYEQSKFEAEKLVVEYRKKRLPIKVYRPAIIVGDSKTGYTNNFKMFYQPLHFFYLELFKEIPADKNTIYSFCPVDYVAEAIIRISLDIRANNNLCCHIVNSNKITLGYFLDEASRYFGFKRPNFISKDFCCEKLSLSQFNLLEPFIPYFNYKLRFSAKNSKYILHKTNFRWPNIDRSFFKKIFNFCIQSGFVKPRK